MYNISEWTRLSISCDVVGHHTTPHSLTAHTHAIYVYEHSRHRMWPFIPFAHISFTSSHTSRLHSLYHALTLSHIPRLRQRQRQRWRRRCCLFSFSFGGIRWVSCRAVCTFTWNYALKWLKLSVCVRVWVRWDAWNCFYVYSVTLTIFAVDIFVPVLLVLHIHTEKDRHTHWRHSLPSWLLFVKFKQHDSILYMQIDWICALCAIASW